MVSSITFEHIILYYIKKNVKYKKQYKKHLIIKGECKGTPASGGSRMAGVKERRNKVNNTTTTYE